MPAPGGEGRAYGFDSDTLDVNSPWAGKIYVVAPNDWAAVSSEVLVYDIPTNSWRDDMPELPTARADLAGTFVPLCTSDPNDGLPGLWTFGGRVNESCDPPLGPTEYYPLLCADECNPFTSVEISGTALLPVGETGYYTATTYPPDASNPVALLWSNNDTNPVTSYSWDTPGTYSVTITAENCAGSGVVTNTLEVLVYKPCNGLEAAEINGPTSLLVDETGLYTVTWTPVDATLPIDILWSNLVTGTVAAYSWTEPGLFSVTVTASNCGGPVEVTLDVEVVLPNYPVWVPLILRAEAK
jgi:hypothetical protein